MVFLNKPFLFMLGGSFIVGGAFMSKFNSIAADKETVGEVPEDLMRLHFEELAAFAKINLSDEDTELKDLIRDYAATLTGVKELSRVLTGSLIVDLIENGEDASAIRGDLKAKLDNLRTSSVSSDPEKYEEFGGEEYYKSYHVLRGIKSIFVEIFKKHLKSLVDNSTDNLEGSTSSDGLIKDGLGKLYDAVLEDYIKFNKPLFVKKVFWKYSSEDQEEKAKKLFEGFKVPHNFSYPTRGSYLFPVLSNDSSEKLKNFLEKLKTESNVDELDAYTDDSSNTHEIITADIVEDENKSSQYIIAYLELLSHNISFEKWKDTGKGTNKDNLSTSKTTDTSNICSLQSIDQRIPYITTDTTEYNTVEKLFCLEKDKSPYKTQKTPLSDFIYLKKKSSSSSSPENWILFKDASGIHAWGIHEKAQNSGSQISNLKKKIIEAGKSNSSSKYKKFDIANELSGWLDKHFYRLFLSKWNDLVKKADSSKTDGGDWKDVVSKIKDLLNAHFIQESLISLRKNITKDYISLVDKYKPIRLDGEIKLINPYLTWAGRFPYKPNDKYLKSTSSTLKIPTVFDFLEQVFLSKYEKLSTDNLSFESELTKELTKELTTKFAELTDPLKTVTNDVGLSNHGENRIFVSLNENSTSSSSTDKLKNSHKIQVANNLWLSMVHGTGALDYLSNKKIYSYLSSVENYGPAPDFTPIAAGTQSQQEKFTSTVWRRFLLKKTYEEFKSIKDPTLYGELLLGKQSNLKDFENLKKIFADIQNVYRDKGLDELSEYKKDYYSTLLTIEYLIQNDQKNLRKHLKNKVTKNNSAFFLFLKKYGKDDICTPDTTKLDKALDVNSDLKKQIWELNNRFLGFDEKDSKDWSEKNCLNRDDILDFMLLKQTQSNPQIRAGYKGLVTADKLSQYLPSELADKFSKSLIPWVQISELQRNIEEIKTDSELDVVIHKLKDAFPDLYWEFALEKHWFNPEGGVSSKYKKGKKLTLDQRKNILSNFLAKDKFFEVKKNFGLSYKLQQQIELAEHRIYDTSEGGSSSKIEEYVKRKEDFLTMNGSKVLVDKEGNKYVAYVSQLAFGDLESDVRWKGYLKKIPQDYIASEIVELASDKNIQKQALYYLWNERGNRGIGKYWIKDSRVRSQTQY